jgi:hypothetical protein
MFEYGEAILVCPVVKHFAKEEDRDALRVIFIMPCRLRVKEVLSFREPKSCQSQTGTWKYIIKKKMNLGFSRGLIPVRRAGSSSSTVASIYCQNIYW